MHNSNKLAKKDLIALYNISYPTLRRWLRRAGLQLFIGRKKFTAAEVVTIFQHLGRPKLARTAAQRLKDVYFKVMNLASDKLRYEEKYQQEMPKIKQDLESNSPEEQDYPQAYTLEHLSANAPQHIWDALCRLRCIAIQLQGAKALAKQQIQASCKNKCPKIKLREAYTRHKFAA